MVEARAVQKCGSFVRPGALEEKIENFEQLFQKNFQTESPTFQKIYIFRLSSTRDS